jgi:Ca2+-binding RTX toxin-like protein
MFNSDGSVQDSFGTNGVATAPLPNLPDYTFVTTPNVLPDGRLLLVAEGSGADVFPGAGALAWLTAQGQLESDVPRVTAQGVSFDQGVGVLPGGQFVFARTVSDEHSEHNLTTLFRLVSSGDDPGPVHLAAGALSVTGTDADDVITADSFGGGDEQNLTVARVGDDLLVRTFEASQVNSIDVAALAGDDIVLLAAGNRPCSISGGDGDDRLGGGGGDDSISGNAGRDRIDGGGGNDRVAGNGGRDKLAGGDGDDQLFGGSSADWLAGLDGNDTLNGEGGNDVLTGGDGADDVHGNAGDDSFVSQEDASIDTINGDRGRDTLAGDDDDDILHGIEATVA